MESEDTVPAGRVAWGLVLIAAAAHLVLQVVTNHTYGIFRDEYYYLACAARPAWGYVDHPPLSIWLLKIWTAGFGDSLPSIRVLPALCGSALIVLTGAAAAELGGGRWAQLLASVAVGVGAAPLALAGSYSMNCFDLLFWLGSYYLLIRVMRTRDGKWWPWMGLVLGIGLLNKIGLAVIGPALVIGLAATRQWHHFKDRRLNVSGLIAAGLAAPYVAWNAANGSPTLEFIHNATSGKNATFTPWAFLAENILEASPVTLPVWAGGLVWLALAPAARRYRLVAVMFAATFVILVAQKGKPYYFASSFPVVMAAGGVAWERWLSLRRWRWVRRVALATVLVGGMAVAPIAIPLLSPDDTVAYARRLGIVPAPQEVSHTSALPQHLSDRLGWENLARVVSETYRSLPAEERDRCAIIGRNYGHAGALEYWSRRYELPPVYSTHNNYWFWGPPRDGGVFIVTGGSRAQLERLFDEVVEGGGARSPHAMESHIRVWVCRRLRMPIEQVWMTHRTFS